MVGQDGTQLLALVASGIIDNVLPKSLCSESSFGDHGTAPWRRLQRENVAHSKHHGPSHACQDGWL